MRLLLSLVTRTNPLQIMRLGIQVDNEDLVFTLEALVEKFGEDIAPYALRMAQQLAIAFVKYSDAQDDDDDDTGGSPQDTLPDDGEAAQGFSAKHLHFAYTQARGTGLDIS